MKCDKDDETVVTIRRILVAIDSSPPSLAALEVAVRLAAEMNAELEGLFVEDVNQLNFAGLPFTRVVDSISATARPVAAIDIERGMKAQAERARHALAAAAGSRVSWSFRVVRGSVETEVLGAARKADLVSLGFTGDRLPGGIRAGSLARRAAFEGPGPVLLLRQAQRAGAPVAVCHEEGPRGERALFCATSFARAHGGELVVVTSAASDVESRAIEIDVGARLRGWGLKPRFLHVGNGGKSMRAAVNAAYGGILVTSANSPLAEGDALYRLVENCSCSLFLAR